MVKFTFTLWTDDGDASEEVTLPGKMEVCPRCEGHGTHLTPSIGQHAYSGEEFMEAFPEPEDRAEYFRRGGIYDVECEVCAGDNVVCVVDEAACISEERKRLLKLYHEQCERDESDAAERRAEARYEY